MSAKECALQDMSEELHRTYLEDRTERFFLNGGKNPTWDVWTVRKAHIVNWKQYFKSVHND